jgi:ribonuclease D
MTKEMVEYAAQDVLYLPQVYSAFKNLTESRLKNKIEKRFNQHPN